MFATKIRVGTKPKNTQMSFQKPQKVTPSVPLVILNWSYLLRLQSQAEDHSLLKWSLPLPKLSSLSFLPLVWQNTQKLLTPCICPSLFIASSSLPPFFVSPNKEVTECVYRPQAQSPVMWMGLWQSCWQNVGSQGKTDHQQQGSMPHGEGQGCRLSRVLENSESGVRSLGNLGMRGIEDSWRMLWLSHRRRCGEGLDILGRGESLVKGVETKKYTWEEQAAQLTPVRWADVGFGQVMKLLHPRLTVWTLCVYVRAQSPSHVRLFETLWTTAIQAPRSTGFSRQEY